MNDIRAIDDENLGVLYGRDCIFVDSVLQTEATLEFKGEINGKLASKIKAEMWITYELIFKNVIKYAACELDTYEADEKAVQAMSEGSLVIVQNSEYLLNMPVREDYNRSNYKHFIIYTYDYVFNVFAADYELKCDFPSTIINKN